MSENQVPLKEKTNFCVNCEITFCSAKIKKYCSVGCETEYVNKLDIERSVDKICIVCNIAFKARYKVRNRQKVCSRTCAATLAAPKVKKEKPIKIKKSRAFSEERKKEYSEKFKGKNNPRFGKKLDAELRKKISEANKKSYQENKPVVSDKHLICILCNANFVSKKSHAQYCSKKCYNDMLKSKRTPLEQWRREHTKPSFDVICTGCSVEFKTKESKLFCSSKCKREYNVRNREIENKNCVICSKEFTVTIKQKRDRTKQTCSRSCQTSLVNRNMDKEKASKKSSETTKRMYADGSLIHPWVGRKHSEKTKIKISLKQGDGRNRGENNPMYGKTHTKEVREQMSIRISEHLGPRPWLRNKTGKFYSNKNNAEYIFRSSWEESVFQFLEQDEKVLSYISEPFRISYMWTGFVKGTTTNITYKRHYVPDILVTYDNQDKNLIEIKPNGFLSYEINQAKFAAARSYCSENNMIYEVWSDDKIKEIQKHLKDLPPAPITKKKYRKPKLISL